MAARPEEDGRRTYIGPELVLGPTYRGQCYACWMPCPDLTQNNSLRAGVNKATGKAVVYHDKKVDPWKARAANMIAATGRGPLFGGKTKVFLFAVVLTKSGNLPDADGHIKKIFDALNGIAYIDDRQIKDYLIVTRQRAADVTWKPNMPESLKIYGTDSIIPSVYVEVVRLCDITGFLVV